MRNADGSYCSVVTIGPRARGRDLGFSILLSSNSASRIRVWSDSTKPVMPGLSRWDKRLNRCILVSRVFEGVGDEFAAVVHPDYPRTPAVFKACEVEQFDHGVRIDLLIDCESEVLSSVFIDDVADLDRLTMPGRIELEIQRPHITWILASGNSAISSCAKALTLLSWQTRRPSSRHKRRKVSCHPIVLAKSVDPGTPVPPPAMITRELMHPRPQRSVLIWHAITDSSAPISAAREPQNLAGKSLEVTQLNQMPHGIVAASWAYMFLSDSSFHAAFSNSAWPSGRFMRVFSSRSRWSYLASLLFIAPYVACHRFGVASLIPSSVKI